jgi:hypothetical protein
MNGFFIASAIGGPRMKPRASSLNKMKRTQRNEFYNSVIGFQIDKRVIHMVKMQESNTYGENDKRVIHMVKMQTLKLLPSDSINANLFISVDKDINNLLKNLRICKKSTNVIETRDTLDVEN